MGVTEIIWEGPNIVVDNSTYYFKSREIKGDRPWAPVSLLYLNAYRIQIKWDARVNSDVNLNVLAFGTAGNLNNKSSPLD